MSSIPSVPTSNAVVYLELRHHSLCLSSVPRSSQRPHEEGVLPATLFLCSLWHLHQPERGEREALPPTGWVPDRPVHLWARQRGRLCTEGVHGETVRDRVSVWSRSTERFCKDLWWCHWELVIPHREMDDDVEATFDPEVPLWVNDTKLV